MIYLRRLLSWLVLTPTASFAYELPETAFIFLDNHCLSCNDSVEREGDFDMESLSFDLADPLVFETWVKVYDRTYHG